MDPIDAFPEHISTTVEPVTLPEKPDVLEYSARQGQKSELASPTKSPTQNTTRSDVGKNIERPVEKSRETAQKYRQEEDLHLQQHVFYQKNFTFGLRTVKSGEINFIKTTQVPMLILDCQPPVPSPTHCD
ncbi:hypothetical protein TNCV_2135411 [Trichonephila clavipes]|nr:hypothetical protein TNCV_2135411 [Trichonephila clavipes]